MKREILQVSFTGPGAGKGVKEKIYPSRADVILFSLSPRGKGVKVEIWRRGG